MTELIDRIRNGVIGANAAITTPFGDRPLVYADYTASGRALDFIEDYIRDEVLPWYANTHTETSFTGAQTTALREQARDIIRQAVNGDENHKVLFCGSGATAAINRLLDVMNLRLPADLESRYRLSEAIPAADRPVVFIGPYEHHSNELPWRESLAEVVSIPLTACGQIDLGALSAALTEYADRPLKIGSFSAASNVTGIKSDVPAVTALLKSHGALSFWDYAAAAPYVAIDMNGPAPIDAVFISPHKFIGGPGTPGVLVAREALFRNRVPAVVGGGTVQYVTPVDHRYHVDIERREEGGTPGIVESIRAGLVFKLQQSVGVAQIEQREEAFLHRAMARLRDCPNVAVLGNCDLPRLAILSLRFRHGDKDLHYGFVVSLLNDLFGIQVRGGCSCAGPYGHSLLGMDLTRSRALEQRIAAGDSILRPGWVRLNFNYFIDESEFEYLLSALELVAEHGWRLLPSYRYIADAGTWRYRGEAPSLPASLTALDFEQVRREASPAALPDYESVLKTARDILLSAPVEVPPALTLAPESEALRWFVLPQEAAADLEQWPCSA